VQRTSTEFDKNVLLLARRRRWRWRRFDCHSRYRLWRRRHLERDEFGTSGALWCRLDLDLLRPLGRRWRRDSRAGKLDAAPGTPLTHEIGVQTVRRKHGLKALLLGTTGLSTIA
jgi:hypothetical protein